ncbi:hypothetical protein ES332_A05G390000v1 [Gossypium tomentosum]|uniref:Uncharacterized protein n=1 Tax=Gossypium tomentosum TaxID=34277 RepID=A0A5D2QQL6_GOSTO|nr:hypothetical protein ES332_A05G390000v1 [Gossypium tomentosum]
MRTFIFEYDYQIVINCSKEIFNLWEFIVVHDDISLLLTGCCNVILSYASRLCNKEEPLSSKLVLAAASRAQFYDVIWFFMV